MNNNTTKIQKDCFKLADTLKKITLNFYTLAKNGDFDTLFNNYKVLESVQSDIDVMIQIFGFENYKVLVPAIKDYFKKNKTKDDMISDIDTLKLILLKLYEVSDAISMKKFKKCVCCGKEVVYTPLSSYYKEQAKKYNCIPHINETLNEDEYHCANCMSSDRDRLIVSFLEKLELQNASGNEKLLQLAPAKTVEHWIHANCTGIQYDSTDLFMKGVTFKSDIQNMNTIKDGEYDYFICSHVLEHVQDDRKAMKELYRILNKDGIGLFLVPIFLDVDCIDEEWGCSEEENWRRFGQGDHCRQYSKLGLVERLEESGFIVNQLGIDYFGKEIFEQCGLEDRAVLYVLTKDNLDIDKKIELIKEKRNKYEDSEPLVSVLLPTYNHEKYVSAAIESVLNQTYKNIELLIADDASTDGTVQELLKYNDKITHLKIFEKNTDCKTFKYLAEKASGKYVAVMHSDDLWDKEKIEMQVKYMENHPDTTVCFTGVACINERDEYVGNGPFVMDNKSREEWLHYLYETGNHLCHPSIMMIKEDYYKLQSNQFIRPLRQLPDYSFWITMLHKGNIHVIEKEYVKFRWHSDENENTSAPTEQNNIRSYNEINYIWYHYIKNMEKELFKNVFEEDIVDKEFISEDELICEKLFILMKRYKRAAIQYAFEVVGSKWDDLEQIMLRKYNFKRQNLYELTGQSC